MKRKLLLACLFIAGMVATQAQNLIENGSFENGMENWRGGNVTVLSYAKTVDGEKYLMTRDSGFGWGAFNANLNYGKEVATGVGGKTYAFSVWVSKSLGLSDITGNLQVLKEDGGQLSDSDNGLKLGSFSFEETGKVDDEASFKELSVVVVLPSESHKIGRLGLNIKKEHVKIDNIEFVEVKSFTNLTVTNYQREVLVTWDAASGTTSYTVQVDSKTPTTVTDSKFFITGLEPNTALSITVSAEGFSTKTLSATTADFGASEVNRIPYVNFTDGTAPTSFYPFIFDSTNAPTDIKVFLDGTEVTAGADGLYTLTAGDNKKLKVTFKDGTQAYELMYTVSVK